MNRFGTVMLKMRFSRFWFEVENSALRTKPAGTSRASAAASASLPMSSLVRARPAIAMFFRLTASAPVPNAVASVIASEKRASATAHTSWLVIFGPPSSAISHIVSPRMRWA